MSFKRWFLKGYVEKYAARVLGQVFWPPVSVAVLAHGDHDDILTIRAGGNHQLPGGIMKNHEGLKEAAKREVREETGFDVEINQLLDVRTPDEGVGGVHFYFEGKVTGGEKNGSWEGSPEFVPREEVRDRSWALHHSHVHEYLFPDN